MANEPVYLGDGVYGDYSTGDLRLYTDNGVEQANEIFINGDVLSSMLKYVERCLFVKINISAAAQKNKESGGTTSNTASTLAGKTPGQRA